MGPIPIFANRFGADIMGFFLRTILGNAMLDHRFHVFALCALGIFVTVLDTSSAVVALPTIADELGTGLPAAQWVIVGNNLTIAALLVPMGRLSDLVGRKRIYIAGCCLFTLGAAGAALAGSIGGLIAARALVGIGSAMTQGTAMAIIVGSFGTHERARALGWQTAAVGLGGIAGPAAGGVIVGTAGWRALFAVTALAMLAIAIAGAAVLRARAVPREARPSFDVGGAVLLAVTVTTGLLALTLGPRFGWSSPAILGAIVLFAGFLAAFVLVERRHAAPMFDLTMFRHGVFAVGALAVVVAFMGISASRFLAPFFLQEIKGLDPSRVGLLLTPAAIVTVLVSPVAGRLADRFGMRRFSNLGFGVAIAGLAVFSQVSADTEAWVVVAALMVLAFGLATFSAPNSTSILSAVAPGAHGVATAFINLCRNMGNVIGIAFATTIVTVTMAAGGHAPSLAAADAAADPAVFGAFTAGIERAYLVLIGLAVAVLALLSAGAWHARARTRRDTASR